MRCLNRLYDKPGDCPVCHMKLKPFVPAQRKSLGFACPLRLSDKVFPQGGRCPFCTLALKEVFDGPPEPKRASKVGLWPELEGKTALYLRPYVVRPLEAERLLRGAGRLRGDRLTLHLPADQRQGLRRGASAMLMPPQGYAKPVLATVVALGPGDQVTLRSSRPMPGTDWATAEIRVISPTELMVPLEALAEDGPQARVFVQKGDAYEPRAVTVTARWERFASVRGVSEGETVAGAGVFWLEAQWRMDHP